MEKLSNMESLEGTVQDIIFVSEDKSFCVFRLLLSGENKKITVTVQLPPPMQGATLSLRGLWHEHNRFGRQFKASAMTEKLPTDSSAIERFLASGAIEGIGEKMARKIVEALGSEALNIIEKSPKALLKVPGIGKKTADKIHISYMENINLKNLMLWLEEHNVSGMLAGKIYARYGSFAQEALEANPYRLAGEVEGIGFNTADALAASIGMGPEAQPRISAAFLYQLQRESLSGHCCVEDKSLIDAVERGLGISRERLWEVLRLNLAEGSLEQECPNGQVMIYSLPMYRAECSVARELLYLLNNTEPFAIKNVNGLVEEWERKNRLRLAPEQKRAVEASLEQGVFVLTGGPGTGKTTVIRGMVELLEARGLKILLGAPTGRAAKRLSEASGRTALTIHRLLEAQGVDDQEGSSFGRTQEEPLEADIIILDEVSMMDIFLMRSFLEAVPPGCHVIFTGDSDQLPPVGPGAVFKDILQSGIIPSIRLKEVFRQQGEGSIVTNAHYINQGRLPILPKGEEKFVAGDFSFIEVQSPEEAEEKILSLCHSLLPEEGYSPLEDIQVLSPMHRHTCGTNNINAKLQERLNPPAEDKKELTTGGRILRLGDKVMQTKNNYEKNVFNGDIGFIIYLDSERVVVRFGEDQLVEYTPGEIGQLQLAYCLTVHKSQGSEYPIVIMPLVNTHQIMLYRKLLYTAVTRARERVILVGSKRALYTAVSNDVISKRNTLLTERLLEVL